MEVLCKKCFFKYNDEENASCPRCGSIEKMEVLYNEDKMNEPRTIEELKKWYQANNYPSEEITRFYIGVDFEEARVFGIYKDESTGNTIVYKNKSNGERAVRYNGPDEDEAVEIFKDRFLQECKNQGYDVNDEKSTFNYRNVDDFDEARNTPYYRNSPEYFKSLVFALVIFGIMAWVMFTIVRAIPRRNFWWRL